MSSNSTETVSGRSGSFWTKLSIDRSHPEPLQDQLYGQIQAAIVSGSILPGSQLPASRTLALEIGCSRNTVVEVLDRLIAEGYLTSVRGSGVYVEHDIPKFDVAAVSVSSEFGEEPFSARSLPQMSTRGVAIAETRIAQRGDPHVAFMPSMPDVSLFPLATWLQLNRQEWQERGEEFVRQADARGFEPLRIAIADYVRVARNVTCDPDQIIITAGAQQGIDLVARLLLDPGDRAWIEDPGYSAIGALLRAAGAEVEPRPVDDSGLTIDEDAGVPPRVITVAPSNQFPTGVMMSLRRRLALLEYAERVGAWIVEDDYDSEFRYEGHPISALAGLSASARERVIYVGTFSKMLFPAIRLGFIIVPKRLALRFANARRTFDLQASVVSQPALARFIAEGHLSSHVRRMRTTYRARRQVLVDALAAQAADFFVSEMPRAGMQLIARFSPALAERYDDVQAAQIVRERGINVQPLSTYYAARSHDRGFVLGYACADEARLRSATAVMVAALARDRPGRMRREDSAS